jgi:hypothetical protein
MRCANGVPLQKSSESRESPGYRTGIHAETLKMPRFRPLPGLSRLWNQTCSFIDMEALSKTVVQGLGTLHLLMRAQQPTAARSIAAALKAPLTLLRSILSKLGRGGLIQSRAGRGMCSRGLLGKSDWRTIRTLEQPQKPLPRREATSTLAPAGPPASCRFCVEERTRVSRRRFGHSHWLILGRLFPTCPIAWILRSSA